MLPQPTQLKAHLHAEGWSALTLRDGSLIGEKGDEEP